MNEAVRGKAIDTRLEPSNNVMSVFQMLEHFNKLIDETPPIDQPQRFGNKAFAQWLNKIGEVSMTDYACQCFVRIPTEAYTYILICSSDNLTTE
jgi:Phosphotyrosyl phosphatase activator